MGQDAFDANAARRQELVYELGANRASGGPQDINVGTTVSHEQATFEIPGEYLCLRVEYRGSDSQNTGWAMEHLRRSFAQAWLGYAADGSLELDVPDTIWVAENHHRYRVAQIQQDYRFLLCGGIRPEGIQGYHTCLLYTSPSPRDRQKSRMPSSA